MTALACLAAFLAQPDQERARELEKLRWLEERLIRPEAEEEETFVDYGIWFRPQYFYFTDGDGKNRSRQDYDLRPWLDVRFGSTHALYLRGEVSYFVWAEGDAPTGVKRDADSEVDIGYYRLSLGSRPTAYAQLGRSYFRLGSGLTFNGIGDGALLGWNPGALRLTAIGLRTPKDTQDLDQSRPNPDETRRDFYGLMVEGAFSSAWVPYVFGLIERDRNREEPEDPAQEYDWDAEFLGVGLRGVLGTNFSFLIELVKGTGERFAAFETAAPEDIDSWAGVFEATYRLGNEARTRFTLAYYIASGDPDRVLTANTVIGNAAGTDDEAFTAFGFIPAGLVLNPLLSNIKVHKLGWFTKPVRPAGIFDSRELEIGIEGFWYTKPDEGAISDPFMDLSKRKVGWEVDVLANWTIFSDLSVTLRAGYFEPSDAPLFRGGREFFLASLVYSY